MGAAAIGLGDVGRWLSIVPLDQDMTATPRAKPQSEVQSNNKAMAKAKTRANRSNKDTQNQNRMQHAVMGMAVMGVVVVKCWRR